MILSVILFQAEEHKLRWTTNCDHPVQQTEFRLSIYPLYWWWLDTSISSRWQWSVLWFPQPANWCSCRSCSQTACSLRLQYFISIHCSYGCSQPNKLVSCKHPMSALADIMPSWAEFRRSGINNSQPFWIQIMFQQPSPLDRECPRCVSRLLCFSFISECFPSSEMSRVQKSGTKVALTRRVTLRFGHKQSQIAATTLNKEKSYILSISYNNETI